MVEADWKAPCVQISGIPNYYLHGRQCVESCRANSVAWTVAVVQRWWTVRCTCMKQPVSATPSRAFENCHLSKYIVSSSPLPWSPAHPGVQHPRRAHLPRLRTPLLQQAGLPPSQLQGVRPRLPSPMPVFHRNEEGRQELGTAGSDFGSRSDFVLRQKDT